MANDNEKLRSFLKPLADVAAQYGKQALLADVSKSIDELNNNVNVLFCGEFKRGKSSLVNAILGEELCPTDIGIATSVVTKISYGSVKKAIRYYGNITEDVKTLRKEEIQWEDIPKYTVGDFLDIDNTVQMELFVPSDFLKDGITIIDTPGIGGLDPRHANLTSMALPCADVAVFITDAGEPMTQSELLFYEKKVVSRIKNSVVLVNKSDCVTSDILLSHLETTKNALLPIGNSPVVSVSAMNWLLYNQLEDDSLKVASNKDAVIAAINSQIKLFKKSKLISLRDLILSEIQDIISTISLQKDQIEADTNKQCKAISDYTEQLKAISLLRNELSNPTSNIRLQINSIFENSRNEVLNMISHEGTVLTTETFDSLLESENALCNDGKWLVAQINDCLEDLTDIVNETTENAFKEISLTLEKEISAAFEAESFNISNDLKTQTIWNTSLAFSLASKLTPAGLMATLGGAIVEFCIPGFGWAAGLAMAGALIWKQVSHENEKQKKMLIRQQVLPKINIVITDLRNQTTTQFTKFHQGLLQTIQTMLSESEAKFKIIQNSIKESKDSEKKLHEQMNELKQAEKFLQTTSSQLKLLYSNPFKNAN